MWNPDLPRSRCVPCPRSSSSLINTDISNDFAEVIINNNPTKGYSTAVDAWSIGVILYSCLTNQTPFDESESAPLPERMLVRKVELDPLHDVGASPTGALNLPLPMCLPQLTKRRRSN